MSPLCGFVEGKSMKKAKKWLLSLFCMALLLSLYPVTAAADTGPKPSVEISFDNVGDEPCYGTLLSKNKSTGPWSVWDGSRRNARYSTDTEITEWSRKAPYEIWWAFVQYEDPDGFFFLQMVWDLRETGVIDWNYYPPSEFKVLLYYPESGRFTDSGIQQRFAFHARYRVDLQNGAAETLRVERAFSWGGEIPSFLFRLAFTLLVELSVALLFGIRNRKQLLYITAVNIVTQLLLNVALLVTMGASLPPGYALISALYLPGLELGIAVLEALAYCLLLKKHARYPRKNIFYILYAIVANAASLFLGFILAAFLPGLF